MEGEDTTLSTRSTVSASGVSEAPEGFVAGLEAPSEGEDTLSKDQDVFVESKIAAKQEEESISSFQLENTNFERMIHQLKENPVFDDFRYEYEKLHKALLISHDSELRLIRKIKSFLSEINVNHENISRSKTEESSMQSRKGELQDDIRDLYVKINEAKAMEKQRRAEVSEYEKRIEGYRMRISAGSGWRGDQEEALASLKAQRDDSQEAVNTVQRGLKSLQMQVSDLGHQMEQLQKERDGIKAESDEVQSGIDEINRQCAREGDQKKSLDGQLKDEKSRMEHNNAQLQEQSELESRLRTELKGLEDQVSFEKKRLTDIDNEIRRSEQGVADTHKKFEEKRHENDRLQSSIDRKKEDIATDEELLAGLKRELSRVTKLTEQARKRLSECLAEKDQLQSKKESLDDKIKEASEELCRSKAMIDSIHRKYEDSCREREILKKSINRAIDSSQATRDLIMIYDNYKVNLENDIGYFIQLATQQQNQIKQAEFERDKYDKEAIETNQRYFAALEDIKLQDLHVSQLQKKILEGETKLKQQQNMYEAVRSDRNLYSKNLLEAHETISQMKRRFKLMNRQIESMKEEITYKDHLLVQEHFEHHKVEKEKEMLRGDLTKVKKQIECSDQIISSQSTEVEKLHAIIGEAEGEQQKQNKEYEAVMSERDLLNSQLIQRNAELSALYEKIRIQKSTLKKGEALFEKKVSELSALKQQVREAQNVLDIERAKIQDLDELKRAKIQLENELQSEGGKVTALTEELEHPLNVHRWRHLEHTDPDSYQIITKIQRIQKVFIEKSQELLQKELLIQQREKLYVELKNILSRQPGPEVREQIEAYRTALKEKKQQKEDMDSELQSFKSKVAELKFEIERQKKQYEEIKQEYFDRKRSEPSAEPK